MPTYVYRREDGTKFEIKQRITDDPLEECPETGQPVERIIAGSAGLIFKGDGFYINDYAKSGSKRKDSNGASDADASSSNETAVSNGSDSGSGTKASSSGDSSSDGGTSNASSEA